MKTITSNDPESKSSDVVSENVAQLKTLFPESVIDGKVDFEVLKQLLGGALDEREEKYGSELVRQTTCSPYFSFFLPLQEHCDRHQRRASIGIPPQTFS